MSEQPQRPIVSLLVFRFFHINIDGVIGLVVSVLVLLAGVNIAKDTLAPLLGQAIEPEVYHRISEFVESYDGIIGSHDLIVHNYGPSRSMASIHAEVPAKVDIEDSHAVVDRIERDALEKLGIFLGHPYGSGRNRQRAGSNFKRNGH